eukprot:2130483-Pyramimonas_sp.AAC.1
MADGGTLHTAPLSSCTSQSPPASPSCAHVKGERRRTERGSFESRRVEGSNPKNCKRIDFYESRAAKQQSGTSLLSIQARAIPSMPTVSSSL